jgi:hypothetical protein
MKNLFVLIFCFGTSTILSQAPQFINYQGVARDANGTPITNTVIGLQFCIATAVNPAFHNEKQLSVPVNSLGLFTTKIGVSPPLPVNGWEDLPAVLHISLSINAGPFTALGTQTLASVPYALYALNSGNVPAAPLISSSNVTITAGNIIDLTNAPVTPGAYGGNAGSNSTIPHFTVDSKGRLTSVNQFSVNINGDIGGTIDNQIINKLRGVPLSPLSPLSGQVLQYNGTEWAAANVGGTGLWTATGGTAVALTNTNNFVSIGESNPSCALHISGLSTSTVLNLFSGAPQSSIRIHNDDLSANNFESIAFSTKSNAATTFESAKIAGINRNHASGSIAGDLVFLTRNPANLNEVMRITSGGNVGIGTISPSQKLEVSGNIQIPSSSEFLYSAPKQKYLSVPVNALAAMRPQLYHLYLDTYIGGSDGESAYGYFNDGVPSADAIATAPVYLPEGATVTEMWVKYYDSDATFNLVISLEKKSHSNITSVPMASAASTGNTSSPSSPATQTITSISNPVIDNLNNAYYLKFKAKQLNTSLGILDIRIGYTINKAD